MTAPPAQAPRITPLGDSAITVTFAEQLDPRAAELVLRLADALRRDQPVGIVEWVPGYVALTIHYSPAELDLGSLTALITQSLAHPAPPRPTAGGRLVEIPVHYDGPDLLAVGEATGLTSARVAVLHAGPEYRVALLGFVPGFAYLTGLDPALVLPRRSAPRPRVPAGSVAIAGQQSGIYPAATPGGWHLIGRTELAVFDPGRNPPSLLGVGDRVRFVPVS